MEVVNRCFNVYEDKTTKNGTEIQTHETSELMRYDFSAYLRDMLPGTLVTFEIKHISPHPLLSSNNHSADKEKKRNTYAVLNIIFDETDESISVKNKLAPSLQQLEIESRIYRTCDSNSMSSGTVESEDLAIYHPKSMLTTSNGKV